ncbi:MAG: alkaline phosphatase D family protein [Bacteroidia bacterium]|nr:alkaline phosphatase D family protein [Bacteroidia bacterium]MCX7764592.1 alkaline phosphatase D family protein [Bacteroidia bacterium]MDW8056827.1 alkaline phosphatase D family protein [Bacteroidia bacterium]
MPFLLLISWVWGQVIVGGVTERSAELYIWDTQAEVSVATLQKKPFSAAEPPIRVFLSELQPSTRYPYEVKLSDGRLLTGAFQTPPITPLRVAFISCHDIIPKSKDQLKAYKLLAEQQPHLIVHLGDWGYPDTTEKEFPPKTRFFPKDWDKLYALYRQRYLDPNLHPVYAIAPWAYIYDDHDYAADNTGRDYRAQYKTLRLPIGDYPFEPKIRENAIQAYEKYFPHYPLIDSSEGLFQRFRWGDVEFFLLDNRSARTGTMRVFEMGELGRYYFRPKPEISILGARQREWLLNALAESKARWKVILSGVTYNRNLQLFIKQVLALPEQMFSILGGVYKVPSIFIAGFIADTWAGYPADQDSLLAWCWQRGIQGVIFVSGDTHIGTLEDGTMGGLPELMTGGIGKTEKRSFQLAKRLGISIFNQGGQGISVNHFRPAFGVIDFYPDSAVVRLIGVGKGEISRMVCFPQDKVLPPSLWGRLESPNLGLMFELKPIGSRTYALRWRAPKRMPQNLGFVLYDSQGKKVWSSPSAPNSYWKQQKQLVLPEQPAGTYFLRAESGGTYYGVRVRLP